MVDILHKVGMKSSTAEVYKALTTAEGIANWWTTDARGDGDEPGGVLRFGFADVKVLDLAPDKKVLWEVIAGPDEWVGTRVDFHLDQVDDYAVVLFKHEGWREPAEMMHHCSTKWATFLLSLKSLIETGKGTPAPDDVRIDNWN
jgi:uncharacterized protein YndB with AHSA1/START domain